ncbi:DUF515 domain-containing protein, partial [Methanobrevibacter sp. OttesenSCG-928-K11]|nr:DUF515 domain-containing protein [Methanobrevibacter sp. OttesenSCG-928-K11]
STAKTSKLNELNSLYKGPLAMAGDVFTLEKKIENSNKIEEVENIDILRPATKSWKSYQLKSIKTNTDSFNRTMAIISTNETKNIIMNSANATKFVNENDATVLSNVKFEKPNTVAVPILINRLQASGGLITIGSIVDIYVSSSNNISNQSTDNGTNPDISGSTVLAILRCEESGSIEADYIKSQTTVRGNTTNPNENIESFSTNVEEMLKGAIAGGYDEETTSNLLNKYGLRLSNLEREANLADLESEYILLIEIPQDKVQYILQNMESIILTIPTQHAPDWMVDELYDTYN